jgi:hypothetical protein
MSPEDAPTNSNTSRDGTQSWASRRSTIVWAGFDRSFGATASRVLELSIYTRI